MIWTDIAGIVFVTVTMNHLGLVKAIEEAWDRELPIINCVKCSTFWACLVYSVFVRHDIIASLAISFFASYSAIWLELIEGFIDTLYIILYEKIYSNPTDTASSAPNEGYSAGSVPEL